MRLFKLVRSGLRLNIPVSGGKSRGNLWALSGHMVCPRYSRESKADAQIPMS